jgi:general secretion pathway protein D
MKTPIISLIVVLSLWAGSIPGRAQQEPTDQELPEALATQAQPAMDEEAAAALIQQILQMQEQLDALSPDDTVTRQSLQERMRALRGQGTRGSAGNSTNAVPLRELVSRSATNGVAGTNGQLRLNFQNASLNLVLRYLSEAAGFVVSPSSRVDLRGRITVFADHPVSRKEAIQLLDKALGEHGYTANVEDNILNIYALDLTTAPIPDPITGADYLKIPPSKDLVTQIVYIRNVEAGSLITALAPLMPNGTSMSSHQGANAIIITDTKANIRRMAQLVKALDTPSVSAARVEVFPLDYADATALAQVISQLFQGDSAQNQGGRGGRGGNNFGANLLQGFGGGGRGGAAGGAATTGRVAAPRVVAVADDRSNSIVVTAAEDQMPIVRALIQQMDVNVDAITTVRIFRLRNADPQETVDQLAVLYPDPSTQTGAGARRGGGGFANTFGARGGAGNTQSSRRLSLAKVTAVADPRSQSVIVSAAQEMMPQIENIIRDLDGDSSGKMKVHIIPVESRDPAELVTDLQSIISTDTTSGNFANRNNNNRNTGALNNRQQGNNQNLNRGGGTTTGFGGGTTRGGTGGTR